MPKRPSSRRPSPPDRPLPYQPDQSVVAAAEGLRERHPDLAQRLNALSEQITEQAEDIIADTHDAPLGLAGHAGTRQRSVGQDLEELNRAVLDIAKGRALQPHTDQTADVVHFFAAEDRRVAPMAKKCLDAASEWCADHSDDAVDIYILAELAQFVGKVQKDIWKQRRASAKDGGRAAG